MIELIGVISQKKSAFLQFLWNVSQKLSKHSGMWQGEQNNKLSSSASAPKYFLQKENDFLLIVQQISDKIVTSLYYSSSRERAAYKSLWNIFKDSYVVGFISNFSLKNKQNTANCHYLKEKRFRAFLATFSKKRTICSKWTSTKKNHTYLKWICFFIKFENIILYILHTLLFFNTNKKNWLS